MRATEMHDLLADVRQALNDDVWKRGEHDGLKNIYYCRYCSYSQSHGHGEDCIIPRLEAATSPDVSGEKS